MSNAKPATPAKKIKVTLARDHTHAGTRHPAGTIIEIPETLLQWFKDHNLIKES